MKIDLNEKYDGKKVLICGASGMTGHNLYDLMEYLGAGVTGTCYKKQEFYSDGKPMFEEIDFTNRHETYNFFLHKDYDYIFICCAKTYNIFVCQDNPASMILDNVAMVSNILDACLRHKQGTVLYMSSATIYQPSTKALYEHELDLNIPPYPVYDGVGWMKRYAEKLCEFYSHQGLEVRIVRPTNIYGRYDKTDPKTCHVIPALVTKAFLKLDPYLVHGTGKAVKNFIHADDLTRDMATVAAYHTNIKPINLCGNEEVSIAHVADCILDITEQKPQIKYLDETDHVPYVGLQRDYFDSLFGKQTYRPLYNGLKDVIEWFYLSPQTPNK